jgi:hypothetical protein
LTLGCGGLDEKVLSQIREAGAEVIDTYPRTTRQFDVSKERLTVLRTSLLNERFFELSDDYGQRVPNGSTTTVTVTAGDQTKMVKLHFLMNWVHNDKAKLREPSRAVRVLLIIRDWFEDVEAVDLRRYDRMVLEASRGA